MFFFNRPMEYTKGTISQLLTWYVQVIYFLSCFMYEFSGLKKGVTQLGVGTLDRILRLQFINTILYFEILFFSCQFFSFVFSQAFVLSSRAMCMLWR